MKLHLLVASLVAFAHTLSAGESSLTTTFQPLNGLGSGKITIYPVTCHDWYSHSGQPTAIRLISAVNVPPANNPKQAKENLNIASVCKVYFYASDIGDPAAALDLTIDVTEFVIPKRFDYGRENIIRTCLECLRRCLPDKLLRTPVTLKASEKDKTWLAGIVSEFNAHDRSKVFYTPPQ